MTANVMRLNGPSAGACPPHLRLAVVGDVMLDRYVDGRADRVSPEAPAIILAAERTEQNHGGAANAARNAAALRAKVDLIGVIGTGATERRRAARRKR